MSKRIYRLGVIGLGEGRSIMSAALNSSRWELRKVCDLNEDLCRTREEEFSFSNWTTAYSDLLNDPEIDVIAIYTPDQLHAQHIKQAFAAGKHVIVTKPMLVSLDSAQELLDAAQQSGQHLFVGQSSRFFEPMRHQRVDYDAGKHGELEAIETYYIADSRWFLERSWSRQSGFSWMYNFMIHAVDLAAWYLPNIEEVVGYGRASSTSKEHGLTVPDTMRFLMKDAEGRIAQVSGSYTTPTLNGVDPSISCTLRGTNGTSRAVYSKLEYYTHFHNEESKIYSYEEKRPYYFRFEGDTHHAGEYQNYIEYFAECLDNDQIPLPDLREGIRTLAIMEAMERSLATGAPVRVDDILRERSLL